MIDISKVTTTSDFTLSTTGSNVTQIKNAGSTILTINRINETTDEIQPLEMRPGNTYAPKAGWRVEEVTA